MTIAKGTGFVRGNRDQAGTKLAHHFKYLEHRPMGPGESREDRFIFSQNEDHVVRRDAIDEVMQHTSSAVNYHRIILSPSKEEPVMDWKTWTRNVMRDLEDYKGQNLHWYAVKHANTDDPHVHVVIAGSGEDRQTGRPKAVKLYTDNRAPDGRGDYAFLRERGQEHSGYAEAQRDQALAQEITREMDALDRVDTTIRHAEQTDQHRPQGISLESKGIDR